MFNTITFTHVEGSKKITSMYVFALSTCGFCELAIKFLKKHNFDFYFVYIDLLPLEVKLDIKSRLREKFNEPISFPYVVLNNQSTLVGFIEEDWKKKLELQ